MTNSQVHIHHLLYLYLIPIDRKSCENVSLHKTMHTCILSSFDNTVTEIFSLSAMVSSSPTSTYSSKRESYLRKLILQRRSTYAIMNYKTLIHNTITWNDEKNLFLKEVMDGSSTCKTLFVLIVLNLHTYWQSK